MANSRKKKRAGQGTRDRLAVEGAAGLAEAGLKAKEAAFKTKDAARNKVARGRKRRASEEQSEEQAEEGEQAAQAAHSKRLKAAAVAVRRVFGEKTEGLTAEDQGIPAVKRRKLALSGQGAWTVADRARKSDAISPEDQALVKRHWAERTRVLPNEKDVRRFRTGPNQYESHPTHLLEKSQTELYFEVCEEHPDIKIKQRKFEELKPWFVRKLKDRNVCCCKYHEEVKLYLAGVNRLRKRGHTDQDNVCECDCQICRPLPVPGTPPPATCQYKRCTYASSAGFCGLLLCPKTPGSLFHKPECINRTCPLCKDKKLPRCPLETQPGEPDVTYQAFECTNRATGRCGPPQKADQTPREEHLS
ncbi:hypothetical protein KFL_010490020 [Klebsormidium nitens]|uniref:Uncharacterized protein n=1 Tax=Klebsormidium nitens TaxID=105231 RepID=A0A1Y1INS7_KLENI|nr:hypothetical protein KFL_010490020 [Klebsormidium nitens]|eukprot:GAQ92555.1 hypothetical protein KFL_010490020 [Klebsormidium nitens]